MKKHLNKYYFKYNFKKVLGVVLAVIGTIIIIQVVPIGVWFFLLGALLIAAGWIFFRMF